MVFEHRFSNERVWARILTVIRDPGRRRLTPDFAESAPNHVIYDGFRAQFFEQAALCRTLPVISDPERRRLDPQRRPRGPAAKFDP